MKKFALVMLYCVCSLWCMGQRTLTDTVMGLHDHTNDVTRAIYSLDGRRLITAGLDRTVHYYESTNWIEIYSYSHSAEVTQVAISRDNSIIASSSKDGKLKIYFLDSAKSLEFEVDAPITGIVFDFGMRFLYVSCSDGSIRPYDLKKGEYTKRKFALAMPVTSITISHTNMIYAGMKNGEIKVLNYMGKEAKTLKAHTGEVNGLYFVFAKGQMLLASSSADYTIKLWDVKTYKELKTFTGHTWTINSVEISRDGQYVLSSSNDGTSRIWSVESGENIIQIPSKGEASRCISINEDNQYVATASIVRNPREFVVYIWDTGLKPVEEPKPEKPSPPVKPAPTKPSPAKPAPKKPKNK
ncbi:MAG: WD40 repeat domain-containing protein [Bacteroidota bacterium]|nr:WD40 repeat domain-containing protein [Bacteroidota bacterium]MDX5429690.1 WD40 repeat domain-containing protein [Bacteroidota bacterium]MDX5468471.1 WD40 repeat domain-containing protein [Bacteroidota bacterium]